MFGDGQEEVTISPYSAEIPGWESGKCCWGSVDEDGNVTHDTDCHVGDMRQEYKGDEMEEADYEELAEKLITAAETKSRDDSLQSFYEGLVAAKKVLEDRIATASEEGVEL